MVDATPSNSPTTATPPPITVRTVNPLINPYAASPTPPSTSVAPEMQPAQPATIKVRLPSRVTLRSVLQAQASDANVLIRNLVAGAVRKRVAREEDAALGAEL